MRKIVAGLIGALLASAMAPAFAAPIFSDDFNRATSQTVGFGWIEGENAAADVRINDNNPDTFDLGSPNNNLQLRNVTGNVSAAHVQSTIGFFNVKLSFDWAPFSTENLDQLIVEYDAGSGYTNLTTIVLNGSSWTSEGPLLLVGADNLPSVSFRFRTNVDDINQNKAGGGNGLADTEGVRLDRVLLVGQVPEPGTLALFGVGLLGLRALRRRKPKA